MWTGKERKWSHPKPACINMSWGLCALGPLQPRWFAISPKRSINGRTWQAANVSGLMHDGETEGLKQRCVHQQVSDSSGWLMLMHFIFKFNCHPRLPRSILIWAPPQSWPYLQHRCERRKILQDPHTRDSQRNRCSARKCNTGALTTATTFWGPQLMSNNLQLHDVR